MSAAVASNHFPAGSVDLPNNYPGNTETQEQRQDLNKEKNIMEFDLNLPAPNDEDLEAVAALQLLSLKDLERQLLVPNRDELNCTLNRNPADFSFTNKENEYMVQLIRGKGNENEEN